MGIYGGLQPEDWTHWGQFTTLKTNAAELAVRAVRPGQVIYCSPLVDPYQPAEQERPLMPRLLEAVARNPPEVFVIQTRSPLILRDLALLQELSTVTKLRISFSVTTDRDEVRRRYEPHCESNDARLEAICGLREARLEVYATLAPLLPSNPERLAEMAIDASRRNLVGDPLHLRQTKPHGATTRSAAFKIALRHGEQEWFKPEFQEQVVRSIERVAREARFQFGTGPRGFGWLTK